tara:strand:- start:7 stop:792 length:786 start_codon:yes stop_codon:yes gene_type:complete
MISCELMGRLGNQMFIAAAAYSLALDNNDEAVFPTMLSGIVPTDRERIIHEKTILSNLKYTNDFSSIQHVYHEPADHSYAPIPYKENLLLKGYFQSEKYFNHNREEILELFRPLCQIETFINKKYSNLVGNKNCVSIHIRRGDYLNLADFHAIIGKQYYEKAMSIFPGDTTFVFFSDDIEWCKETFENPRHVFIEKQDDVLDLYLMSKIPNNIIANSSFSWWAAWLNENKNKKIISPSVWFGPKNQHLTMKDLIPDDWQKI